MDFPSTSQPGQTSTDEVKRRDLRAELLAAETEAREKKRKADGKPALQLEGQREVIASGGDGDESNKRRKVLQDVIALDRDDDEENNGASRSKVDSDADSECVTLVHFKDVFLADYGIVMKRSKPIMKTRMRMRMILLSFYENWRRSNVNEQRRRLDKFRHLGLSRFVLRVSHLDCRNKSKLSYQKQSGKPR